MTTPTEPTEAVARGAALLDEKMPGWESRIDVQRLNITSYKDSMLGQLYGRYNFGLDSLKLNYLGDAPLGFNGTIANMDALTEAWRRLIAERRFAAQRESILSV